MQRGQACYYNRLQQSRRVSLFTGYDIGLMDFGYTQNQYSLETGCLTET